MSRSPAVSAVRLAHFSDIHLTAHPLGWRGADWFNKRLTGWLHLRALGRGRHFRDAEAILTALVADWKERQPDWLVFSGDATALGFEREMARAATMLRVGQNAGRSGLAVPGNHDYYTPSAAVSGLFERYFAPWQRGEREDGATYPFAQRIGHLWLIGVNSCTGNRRPWDAAGSVDVEQLHRLERLLARLDPGPRILVTHYPICQASGAPERRSHGLRNLAEVVRVAERGGVCLWLHGHRHAAYSLATSRETPFPVVCAGSATQQEIWSYGEYRFTGSHLQATRRVYTPQMRQFRDVESFALELPCAT